MRSPAIANAVTNSGEATKAWVFGLPSARFAKFRLNEWTIVFFSWFSAPARAHWPIHGPQAFANTSAPNCSKISIKPSLSIVYLTCSEPGVIVNLAFVLSPLSTACFAIDAAREISS